MSEVLEQPVIVAEPTGLLRSEIELLDRINKGGHFIRQNYNGKWSSIPFNDAEHKQRLSDLKSSIKLRSK